MSDTLDTPTAEIPDLMSDKVLDRFRDVPCNPDSAFIYDFMGQRSHVDFNGHWTGKGGTQKPMPVGNWEWIPVLWAATAAKDSGRDRFTMLECGAGWGPWIMAGYGAARQLGISQIAIVGVEAERQKYEFILRHFADNGVTTDQGRAVHGIVAADTGIALFPVATDPSLQWGLKTLGVVGTDRAKLLDDIRAKPVPGRSGFYTVAKYPGEYNLVDAYSLPDLMGDHDLIDMIHFDIQGAEGEVIAAAIDEMNRRVRGIFVGTHSGEIEALLRALMPGHDWLCVKDKPQPRGPDGVLRDGTQVWLNRRFL